MSLAGRALFDLVLLALGVALVLVLPEPSVEPAGLAAAVDEAMPESGVGHPVTAVLLNFRGYDTLGEVFVVFTAGIGVLLLLGRERKRGKPEEDET